MAKTLVAKSVSIMPGDEESPRRSVRAGKNDGEYGSKVLTTVFQVEGRRGAV